MLVPLPGRYFSRVSLNFARVSGATLLYSAGTRNNLRLTGSDECVSRPAGWRARSRCGLLSEGLYVLSRMHTSPAMQREHLPHRHHYPRPTLQKGLDPAVKARRVANYAISMREEVELIAHSYGVLNPQALSRQHTYIVDDQGQPSPLDTKRNCHREALPLITTAATNVPASLTVRAGSSDFSRKLCRAQEANLH